MGTMDKVFESNNILAIFSFWEEDWALDYNSMEVWALDYNSMEVWNFFNSYVVW